jgi:EAL domain-containing protein (putative c-di-GMP-specific phosphodiesterase class I)
VDKSFVDDMNNEFTLAIIKAIITIGHSLGMEITAEGVETEHQRKVLAELGCTQLQGYLIAKPMDYDALCEFLSQQPRVKDPLH